MKTVRFLFNDEMARAVVEGRKTVTRRPVKNARGAFWDHAGWAPRLVDGDIMWHSTCDQRRVCSGPGYPNPTAPCSPGDLLIGRECWRYSGSHFNLGWPDGHREIGIVYRADGAATDFYRVNEDGVPKQRSPRDGESAEDYESYINRFWKSYRPSIHMPDWAARIRRRVVSVTVERLHGITEDDAVREGFTGHPMFAVTARDEFESAWDSIYAAKGLGWAVDPWCWRIEFSAENAG